MPTEMHVNVYEARTVELKAKHRYLVLLKGASISDRDIHSLRDELNRLGFEGLVVGLPSDVEVSIIEQPPIEVQVPKNAKGAVQSG